MQVGVKHQSAWLAIVRNLICHKKLYDVNLLSITLRSNSYLHTETSAIQETLNIVTTTTTFLQCSYTDASLTCLCNTANKL